MALDKPTLIAALTEAFKQGKANPEWTLTDAATAMADAIDAYVRAAEVSGITTNVVDASANPIGTGSQTGAVTLS
jgi:hypothetical protein